MLSPVSSSNSNKAQPPATKQQLTTNLPAPEPMQNSELNQTLATQKEQEDSQEKQQHSNKTAETTALTEEANTQGANPDFTLNLSSAQESTNPHKATAELKPDEIRYGRRRPNLPLSFNFGMRRPLAVEVIMRRPVLGSMPPATSALAIQDSFDLAATNRLPYLKGSGLHLIA